MMNAGNHLLKLNFLLLAYQLGVVTITIFTISFCEVWKIDFCKHFHWKLCFENKIQFFFVSLFLRHLNRMLCRCCEFFFWFSRITKSTHKMNIISILWIFLSFTVPVFVNMLNSMFLLCIHNTHIYSSKYNFFFVFFIIQYFIEGWLTLVTHSHNLFYIIWINCNAFRTRMSSKISPSFKVF